MQCLIARMCLHSNVFHVIVLHFYEYVYIRRTPSRKGSWCNAGSRIKLNLNHLKVTMFVMSDGLISDIHSTEIMYALDLYHMTPERGLICIMELELQVLECPSLFVWCYIYVISCTYFYAMKSLGLSVEELTSLLLPLWLVSCYVLSRIFRRHCFYNTHDFAWWFVCFYAL